MKFVKIGLLAMLVLVATLIYLCGGVAFGGLVCHCVQWASDNQFMAGFFGGLGAVIYYLAIPNIVQFGIEQFD